MSTKVALAREVMSRIVRMLSEKKVKVTQQGTRAFVTYDGRTGVANRVNLPYLPDDASDELLEAVQGYLDHEVAHILFTNHAVVKQAAKLNVKMSHNVIEDSFIEREMGKQFSGSGLNLRNVGNFFLREVVDRQLAVSVKAAYANLFVCAVRAWGGSGAFTDYMSDKWQHVKPITDALGSAKDEVIKCRSSQDCLDLAIKFEKLMEIPKDREHGDEKGGSPSPEGKGKSDPKDKNDEPGEPPEDDGSEPSLDDFLNDEGKMPDEYDDETPPDVDADPSPPELEGEPEGEKEPKPEIEIAPAPEEKKDSTSKGDKGKEKESAEKKDPMQDKSGGSEETASEGSTKSDEASKENSEDEAGSEGGSGTDDIGDSSGDTMGGPSLLSELKDQAEDPAFSQALEDAISELASKTMGESTYSVYSTDDDVIEEMPIGGDTTEDSDVQEMQNQVDHLVGPLQKDLERAVAAKSRGVWSSGHRTGRLHSGGLARLVAFNDGRVFRRKEITHTKDVAVSLLIDCSGSMAGSKLVTAAYSAYGLSAVLDRMNIVSEVLGFTAGSRVRRAREDEELEFSRCETLYMPILKTFNDRMTPKHIRRFSTLPGVRWLRNNIDGECVAIAANRLAKRKESRKILMVLSDGMPAASGGDNGALNRHLYKTVKEIENSGIDVLGIGIETDAVAQFYTKHVQINRVSELPQVVIGEVKKLLMK